MIDRIEPTRRPAGLRPVMRQSWRDLLFLHWTIPPAEIQALLPPGLTVDTFDGCAYVGLVPFSMRDVRPVWAPALPGLSNFEEINVRTYVHKGGANPGVWFFSLDASNSIAVRIARLRFHLPYYNAGIAVKRDGATMHYRSQRHVGWGGDETARSSISYESRGAASASQPGTLEFFLAERYLLYSYGRGGLWRGQVHHTPYPLQPAHLLSLDDTLIGSAGISLPPISPLAHYAAGVDVDIYPLQKLDR